MSKIILEVNNNKVKLIGPRKILNDLYDIFSIKHPMAFHLRPHMQKGWDGMQHYITEAGYIKTGLLPRLYKILTEMGHDIEFHDYRAPIPTPILPKKIGDHTPRPYQAEAITSIIKNKVGDFEFPMGVIDAATNAGKTTIAVGLYLAYQRKLPAIMLLNDSDLFAQFMEEIPKLVGKEDFGYVQGKNIKWGKFTIAMVQTVSQNRQKFEYELSQFGICLVDEADLGDNKTYKSVIQKLYNTSVRVGLSGTIYMSDLVKFKLKNENLKTFFSEVTYKITKREMVDLGFSTELVMKIVRGNIKPGIKGDWQKEYRELITENEDRHLVSAQRTEWNIKQGRLPAIIICQYHKHIENMYRVYKDYFPSHYNIKAVHGDTKDRKQIFKDLADGKIDILISSFIVKRGKNLPLLQYLQNAAGGDSNETISQLMGRMERTHESKNKSYIDDLYDEGHYLIKHSKHRIKYYKAEKFKVIIKL